MMLKVGLTGGIASGKSTVGRRLAQLGALVIDADRLVDDLYRPGNAGHVALVRRYGSSILTASGEIDRPELSRIALASPESADELNNLIHPLVVEEEQRRYREAMENGADRIVVFEAPLLLESGGQDRCDRVVVVDTDPETQVARAVKRGLPEIEVRRRMRRQWSRERRLSMADFVIDSSGPLDETLRAVDRLWQELLNLNSVD